MAKNAIPMMKTSTPNVGQETSSRERLESLARELFIISVTSAGGRAKELRHLAEMAFADAAAFYTVADERRESDLEK